MKIDEVIVVEGRDDVDAVGRAAEAEVIATHGYGITRETWLLLEKAAAADAKPAATFSVETPVEKQLALQLLQFGPTVLRAAENYKPSVLADYLFQTAQLYSSFYQRSPILKSEPAVRDARLALCALFGRILSKGLSLLGIETPKRI